jgi:signal transduction histidine kinase
VQAAFARVRRSVAASPRRTDAVLAAVLAIPSVVQVLVMPIAPRAVGVVIALSTTVPIAFRHTHPIPAVLAGTALWVLPTDGYVAVGYVAAFFLFYSLGTEVDDLRVVGAVLVWAIAVSVVGLIQNGEVFGEWVGAFTAVLAPATVGRLVRRERERTQRIAVAEERARIARELHDVVAHGVSVIAVQADAAEAALAHDPALAARPLQTIRGTARDALVEMRRMLGVLRDGEAAEHGPQPGLGQLPALVDHAGLPVRLTVEGEPRALPPSLDLTAYRIVQEALTNVRKHAPQAHASVNVCWQPALLELVVRDGGPGANGALGGHGLVGMRERVRIHGGSLRVGPAAGGGFEVVAELPLP